MNTDNTDYAQTTHRLRTDNTDTIQEQMQRVQRVQRVAHRGEAAQDLHTSRRQDGEQRAPLPQCQHQEGDEVGRSRKK